MAAASPTVVGGLIFCISAIPHLGSLFPLFHEYSALSTLEAAACADLRAPAWSAEAVVVMQPWDTDVLHPGLLILVLNSVKPGVK